MREPTNYPHRFVLCCVSGQDDEAISKAKGYVKEQGLTSEDVKIVRDEGCILVVTKREVRLRSVKQSV